MKIIIACCLLLFVSPLMAQDSLTLAWDSSTSEPLDLGEGGGYRVYCNKQKQTYVKPDDIKCTVAEGPNQCTFDTTGWRGRNYCIATAYLVEGGEEFESEWSNEVSHPFNPNPPGNLTKVLNVVTVPVKKAADAVAWLLGRRKNLTVESYEWGE